MDNLTRAPNIAINLMDVAYRVGDIIWEPKRNVELETGSYTETHRHKTGGFGTPMLVLLLSIFNTEEQITYRTDP